jgi:hypothetical protein
MSSDLDCGFGSDFALTNSSPSCNHMRKETMTMFAITPILIAILHVPAWSEHQDSVMLARIIPIMVAAQIKPLMKPAKFG